MNTIDLQKEIIERISVTTDIDLLSSIKTMLDDKRTEPFIYLTSEEELELLQASSESIKGNVTCKSEMDKKVDQWLKE